MLLCCEQKLNLKFRFNFHILTALPILTGHGTFLVICVATVIGRLQLVILLSELVP